MFFLTLKSNLLSSSYSNLFKDDWEFCRQILPKVSRTFALNISVLRGELYRSILVAYLFCRIIDTVEDSTELDPKIKIELLVEFYQMFRDPNHRKKNLLNWIDRCHLVDGNTNDLDLLMRTDQVFRVFDSLKESHKKKIIPSVCCMAQGMAYFQKRFKNHVLNLLEDENELEEYSYFVAGCVGEMLCNLFFVELPKLSDSSRKIMKQNAVSFGLGLQITNITKDFLADRKRGWSYIPKTMITSNDLTVEEFNSGQSLDKNLKVIKCLLNKTINHLQDALKFTLALPRTAFRIRLFCIWPLWMALETVAELNTNHNLLESEDPLKISRTTVKAILSSTSRIAWSNNLLTRSFNKVLARCDYTYPIPFYLEDLQKRLNKISLDFPELNSERKKIS